MIVSQKWSHISDITNRIGVEKDITNVRGSEKKPEQDFWVSNITY